MKYFVFLIIISSVLSCKSKSDNQTSTIDGKDRLQLVAKTSYRSLNLTDDQQSRIIRQIERILQEIETLDSVRLFYIDTSDNMLEVNSGWTSADKLISDSYNLWKSTDIDMTLALYPSFSQNAKTLETEKTYVIEVEFAAVTGTARMFFDSAHSKTVGQLTYTDRN